jgi:hypothetical protein
LASGLCIQKFRSWQPDFEGQKDRSAAWKSGILGGKNAVSSRGRNYRGFSPSAFALSAPFCRSIAQSFNSNRQATFDRCSDEIRGELREGGLIC